MLTEKDYCDYETSVALKELGYPCDTILMKNCNKEKEPELFISRPHLYYDQKWLREVKGIHIEVLYQPATWTCKIYNLKNKEYIKGYTFFISYEEALSEGIKEAIKILKGED